MEEQNRFPQYLGVCNKCKKNVSTEVFNGALSNILYICEDCVKELKKGETK